MTQPLTLLGASGKGRHVQTATPQAVIWGESTPA